jgi:CMP-N,N'-diacetyllegionaminic acid synthase
VEGEFHVGIVSIIPARKGSKRVPEKNIKALLGYPLIYFSIKVSRLSQKIERTFVTTEDERIASIAMQYGAEVIRRPKELATDTATTLDTVKHAAEYLMESDVDPKVIVVLQPTNPIRDRNYVDRALDLFLNSDADSLLGVTAVHLKLSRFVDGYLKLEYPETVMSQELPIYYKTNGSIVISRYERTLPNNTLFGKRILPYIMEDRIYSPNIDTEFDFYLAELILQDNRERFKELFE